MNTLSQFYKDKHINEKQILLKELELKSKVNKLISIDQFNFNSIASGLFNKGSDSIKNNESISIPEPLSQGIHMFKVIQDLINSFKSVYAGFRKIKN